MTEIIMKTTPESRAKEQGIPERFVQPLEQIREKPETVSTYVSGPQKMTFGLNGNVNACLKADCINRYTAKCGENCLAFSNYEEDK